MDVLTPREWTRKYMTFYHEIGKTKPGNRVRPTILIRVIAISEEILDLVGFSRIPVFGTREKNNHAFSRIMHNLEHTFSFLFENNASFKNEIFFLIITRIDKKRNSQLQSCCFLSHTRCGKMTRKGFIFWRDLFLPVSRNPEKA